MDGHRFDALLRTAAISRRPFLGTLVGAGLAALLPRLAHRERAAARKGKGKTKKRKKKPQQAPCGASDNPCSGCCDAAGQCQSGFSDDACGRYGGACEVCTGDHICDLEDMDTGRTRCCTRLGGNCTPDDGCCAHLLCFENTCCIPVGSRRACADAGECCTGACVNGGCCLFEDFECLLDDECCGNMTCETEAPGKFVCCPPNRRCGGKCCAKGLTCRENECRPCPIDECQTNEDCCNQLACLDDQLSPGTNVCCPASLQCGNVCCSPIQHCRVDTNTCSDLCDGPPCEDLPGMCVFCIEEGGENPCGCCTCEIPRQRICKTTCE
jgi:hypothetical protein